MPDVLDGLDLGADLRPADVGVRVVQRAESSLHRVLTRWMIAARQASDVRLGCRLHRRSRDIRDDQGRPTGGTRADIQCSSRLSITYDDAARTLAIAPTGPAAGLICLGLGFATRQTFDADGNVISETNIAGGTSTSIDQTITSTAQVCK
jgi:hypothetical protein